MEFIGSCPHYLEDLALKLNLLVLIIGPESMAHQSMEQRADYLKE